MIGECFQFSDEICGVVINVRNKANKLCGYKITFPLLVIMSSIFWSQPFGQRIRVIPVPSCPLAPRWRSCCSWANWSSSTSCTRMPWCSTDPMCTPYTNCRPPNSQGHRKCPVLGQKWASTIAQRICQKHLSNSHFIHAPMLFEMNSGCRMNKALHREIEI